MIAIFYHCLFQKGEPPAILPQAAPIISEQMIALSKSGLMDAADFFLAGVNGGPESVLPALSAFPQHSSLMFHGLQSHNECSTILALEKWLPGHQDWKVLYFHAKGSTHSGDSADDKVRTNWRKCMMRELVLNWRRCVDDLDAGCDAVGCHWMTPPKTPPGQNIFAGNFWWAKASYLLTLPSIMDRPRIKESGLHDIASRYEAEVWIGNGPRLPKVKDYHPAWIDTCTP